MHLIMRTFNIADACSLGVLYLDGEVWLRTIEREWLGNKPFISCIREGTYDLVPFNSPRFGLAYHLENPELGVTVTGESQRNHILIHPANLAIELEGCIALGLHHSPSHYGVSESRKAIKKFNSLLGLDKGQRHHLSIIREGIGL